MPQCGSAKTFFAIQTTQHRKFTKGMSTKELTTRTQLATSHGLFAGHLSRWRESLPSSCKLCRETEETSLHLWGECPALKLERMQLSSLRTGGRSKTPHRLILDFFEHEKIRGLTNANSELLEESDPDDPPTQSENGDLSHLRKESAFKSLSTQRIAVEVEAAGALLLTSKSLLTLESFCE